MLINRVTFELFIKDFGIGKIGNIENLKEIFEFILRY